MSLIGGLVVCADSGGAPPGDDGARPSGLFLNQQLGAEWSAPSAACRCAAELLTTSSDDDLAFLHRELLLGECREKRDEHGLERGEGLEVERRGEVVVTPLTPD
jgi:hypothetical protein